MTKGTRRSSSSPPTSRWFLLSILAAILSGNAVGSAGSGASAWDDEDHRSLREHPKYSKGREGKVVQGEYVVICRRDVADVDKKVKELIGGGSSSTVTTISEQQGESNGNGDEGGGRVDSVYKKLHGCVVSKPTPAALKRLLDDDDVLVVEENEETFIAYGEDGGGGDEGETSVQDVDLSGVDLWGLDRIDPQPDDGYYRYSLDGEGIDVFVLDTGIRASHVEFEGRATCPASFVPGESCDDKNSHGTHCAGVIGSKTYGVAKKVNLIGVKVLSNAGTGTTAMFASAVDWVLENRDRTRRAVISASMGTSTISETMNNAIEAAVEDGIFLVAAAGNHGVDACAGSPGSSDLAMVVGAVNKRNSRPSWSNYGSCLDMFAPGVGIFATGKDSDTDSTAKSGTSMAAPFVAGAGALHMQNNPDATPQETKRALKDAAIVGEIVNGGLNSPNLLLQIPQLATEAASTKPSLEFQRTRPEKTYSYDFKILQLSDLHLGESSHEDKKTWDLIDEILWLESPDLVVVAGDIITSEAIDESTKDGKAYYDELASHLEMHWLPWAFVFGDKDVAGPTKTSREALVEAARQHALSMTQLGPDGLPGASNYYLDINLDGRPATRVFFFDSGGGELRNEIDQSQVDWFNSNNDPSIPALAFQHIPSYPSYFEFDETRCRGFQGFDKPQSPKGLAYDAGLFKAMRNSGNVKLLGVAHNHDKGYCCNVKDDFNFCFGRRTGYGGRLSWFKKGATVYHLHLDADGNLKRWHSYDRMEDGSRVDWFDPRDFPKPAATTSRTLRMRE